LRGTVAFVIGALVGSFAGTFRGTVAFVIGALVGSFAGTFRGTVAFVIGALVGTTIGLFADAFRGATVGFVAGAVVRTTVRLVAGALRGATVDWTVGVAVGAGLLAGSETSGRLGTALALSAAPCEPTATIPPATSPHRTTSAPTMNAGFLRPLEPGPVVNGSDG